MKQKSHKIELGRKSENIAVKWLEQRGFQILERNFTTVYGEVDIIARKRASVYFFEVRSRSGDIDPGEIAMSVSQSKVHRLQGLAMSYLKARRMSDVSVLIVVLAVSWLSPNKCKIKAIPVH